MKRVAIIVLNWNGIADTLECLDSLQKQSYKYFTILVVDNGSTDKSVELLNEYHKKHPTNTEIIRNPKNFGFAGGVNTGIKWAIKNGYDYVALFNNDAIADKKWLQELVDAIKSKEIGISTGLLLLGDGKKIDCTGEQYSNWGLPFPRDRNHRKNKTSSGGLVFGASGGASLYKTEMLRDIGLFDEDFFAYYEDVDISFRAQLAGWKVVYNPEAIAYHKQGATANKMSGFAVYQTFKNLPMLFIKNVPTGLLLPIGFRLFFAYWLMYFNAVAKGNGMPATKGVWMSFILGFKKLGERRVIQKNEIVSVKYIKSILWKDLPPDQTGIHKLLGFFTAK
jgi:GT2 family glycosyltransferase